MLSVEVCTPVLLLNQPSRKSPLCPIQWCRIHRCAQIDLVGNAYAHLLPKSPKTIGRKTFGHPVCNIVACRDLLQDELSLCHAILNEVISNFDTLRGVVMN